MRNAKTNFMIFHSRQKKVNVNIPLILENTVIKQATETKFLGVLIDQHLSWKPHFVIFIIFYIHVYIDHRLYI